jgi:hypothetical protein
MAHPLQSIVSESIEYNNLETAKEDAMGTLMKTLLVTLASVAPALASNGGEGKGSSLLLILFLGFAALIIVFQFIPGLVLFLTMLKGIFTAAPKKVSATSPGGPGKNGRA